MAPIWLRHVPVGWQTPVACEDKMKSYSLHTSQLKSLRTKFNLNWNLCGRHIIPADEYARAGRMVCRVFVYIWLWVACDICLLCVIYVFCMHYACVICTFMLCTCGDSGTHTCFEFTPFKCRDLSSSQVCWCSIKSFSTIVFLHCITVLPAERRRWM